MNFVICEDGKGNWGVWEEVSDWYCCNSISPLFKNFQQALEWLLLNC